MKFKINLKIIFTILAMAFALISFACQNSSAVNNTNPTNAPTTANKPTNPVPDVKQPTMTDYPVGNAQTPSEAYRMLFAAVKSQETAKIKSMMSKSSIGLIESQAGRSNQPVEKVFANGLTETTFAENFPQIRDERVKGNYGAVEVWNESRKKWDDLPFVKEDGSWKLAVGDAFAGTFQTPGKGQAQIEQENANTQNPTQMINPIANSNVNAKITAPKKRIDKSKNK